MTDHDPLDDGFLDARRDLIELAAFLDRVPDVQQQDPRLAAIQEALHLVRTTPQDRTASLLNFFSDQQPGPREVAPDTPVRGIAPPIEPLRP